MAASFRNRPSSKIEGRQNERRVATTATGRMDSTAPIEIGDGGGQGFAARINTVQRGQLAHVKARMLMQLAQYRLWRN